MALTPRKGVASLSFQEIDNLSAELSLATLNKCCERGAFVAVSADSLRSISVLSYVS